MNASELAHSAIRACESLRSRLEAWHRGDARSRDTAMWFGPWMDLERDAHILLTQARESETAQDISRICLRIWLAKRAYHDARLRGESGAPELERWRSLDAELEVAEDRIFGHHPRGLAS